MERLARREIGRIALMVAVLLLAACGAGATPTAEPAPTLDFATFDGGHFALEGARGSVVVLNFWASWCGPCRTEMPAFDAAARRYRERGVLVVGLATKDNEAAARAFATGLGVTYTLGFDQGDRIAARYNVYGLPSTLFIARDGTIARRVPGILSEEQLTAHIEELVGR